jgi:hypothetical protein
MTTPSPSDLRDLDRAHHDSMRPFADALDRFLQRSDRSPDATSSLVLGGLTRRSLLRVGGLTVVGGTLLAACGGDDSNSSSTDAPVATSGPAGSAAPPSSSPSMSTDVVVLRTASSIEELAVAAYQLAIDSGLVTTAAVGDAAKMFQDHHREHSALFQAATTAAGGEPFAQANPAVLAALQPAIDALADEAGVLMLALDLENAAAQTYQANVGAVVDVTLNKALMSVGGVEARHAAVIAGVLGQPPVPRSFGGADAAIAPGTGV